MNLARFKACVAGYSDRLFDYQILSVHAGYWSGYYSGAKRPKPLNTILQRLFKEKQRADHPQKHVSNIDVASFMEMEARFKQQLAQRGSD